MEKKVVMPKLGSAIKPGILAAWIKSPGDKVKKGDILFEVESDKVVMGIEALEEGTLKEIYFEAGDMVSAEDIVAAIESE